MSPSRPLWLWKSTIGSVLVGAGQVAAEGGEALGKPGLSLIGRLAQAIGLGLLGIGIASKLERAANGKKG